MGRIAFLQLLVFAMPIGIHHLFADPQIGAGFKFLHAVFTGMVAVPTLLTIFTICASLEIAGRLRGGRGLLGWIGALPWDRPLVLASALSLVMLGLGGAGGLINMSYALNSTVHNTQFVTAHFHLIYGGAVVIMYFAHRLRALAEADRARPGRAAAGAAAAVELVRRHDGRHAAVARRRHHGPAAAHGLLRLQPIRRWRRRRSGSASRPSAASCWWLDAAADRPAGRLGAQSTSSTLPAALLARGPSAAPPAGIAERLRHLDAAGARPDRRQLRLSAGAVAVLRAHRRRRLTGCGLR